MNGLFPDGRFVGSDLRVWHRLWTDYGPLESNALVRGVSVPKNLAFLIPEILARPAIAGRARTLPVPPVGRPVGRREEASALSEARFHKSVKSGRGAPRAFD